MKLRKLLLAAVAMAAAIALAGCPGGGATPPPDNGGDIVEPGAWEILFDLAEHLETLDIGETDRLVIFADIPLVPADDAGNAVAWEVIEHGEGRALRVAITPDWAGFDLAHINWAGYATGPVFEFEPGDQIRLAGQLIEGAGQMVFFGFGQDFQTFGGAPSGTDHWVNADATFERVHSLTAADIASIVSSAGPPVLRYRVNLANAVSIVTELLVRRPEYIPSPTGVTVTAAGDATEVQRGRILSFSAAVVPADAPQDVVWDVYPGVSGVSISATGLLSVSADAPLGPVTVRATASDTNPPVRGTATLNIIEAEGIEGTLGDFISVGGGIDDAAWRGLPIVEGGVVTTEGIGPLAARGEAILTWAEYEGGLVLEVHGGRGANEGIYLLNSVLNFAAGDNINFTGIIPGDGWGALIINLNPPAHAPEGQVQANDQMATLNHTLTTANIATLAGGSPLIRTVGRDFDAFRIHGITITRHGPDCDDCNEYPCACCDECGLPPDQCECGPVCDLCNDEGCVVCRNERLPGTPENLNAVRDANAGNIAFDMQTLTADGAAEHFAGLNNRGIVYGHTDADRVIVFVTDFGATANSGGYHDSSGWGWAPLTVLRLADVTALELEAGDVLHITGRLGPDGVIPASGAGQMGLRGRAPADWLTMISEDNNLSQTFAISHTLEAGDFAANIEIRWNFWGGDMTGNSVTTNGFIVSIDDMVIVRAAP